MFGFRYLTGLFGAFTAGEAPYSGFWEQVLPRQNISQDADGCRVDRG